MSKLAMTNQVSEKLDDILQNLSWAQHKLGTKGLIPLSKHEYEAKSKIESIIRTEKLKLLDELDKSMPTAEQLFTKYGYHLPQKQYGYKLALYDIREVLAKLEAEL